jgi:hypothetical protein
VTVETRWLLKVIRAPSTLLAHNDDGAAGVGGHGVVQLFTPADEQGPARGGVRARSAQANVCVSVSSSGHMVGHRRLYEHSACLPLLVPCGCAEVLLHMQRMH